MPALEPLTDIPSTRTFQVLRKNSGEKEMATGRLRSYVQVMSKTTPFIEGECNTSVLTSTQANCKTQKN